MRARYSIFASEAVNKHETSFSRTFLSSIQHSLTRIGVRLVPYTHSLCRSPRPPFAQFSEMPGRLIL